MTFEQKNIIRTIVVDDEPLARSNLSVLLRRQPEIDLVGEYGSGLDAISGIRQQKPDLLFLDVQMPECNGFDVIEHLGLALPCAIVFVTAYDQYAVRAFEAGALDYLLKPFDDDRFHRALTRAKEKIALTRTQTPITKSLAIRSAGSVFFVDLSEIDWIEAADYYSCLHVGAATHLLRRSISELEGALEASAFCRIHRSTIVQLDRVRALKLNASGEYDVVLANGTALRLSRRYRKHLQACMNARGSEGF